MLELFSQQGDETAREFIAWFRTVRLEQKDRLRRHRFIVGGSIGIDVILRRLKTVDKLNDFERLYVEPLEREHGVRLVRDLAETMDVAIDDEMVSRILELIGPAVPYFIHLLFSQLGQLAPDKRQPLKLETLKDTYQQRILGPTCKHYFDHYRERLGRYGKARERGAMAVLKAVAEAPHGRIGASALFDFFAKAHKEDPSDEEFAELLADLECDWYLSLDARTNEYFFYVDVMKDWWRRWYGPRREQGPRS